MTVFAGIDYSPGWSSHFQWVLIAGFFVSFILSFGMGANDCANSYGTVVGAGVLTLFQVYFIATFTETSGAALLGYRVTDTMRESIVDLGMYDIFAVTDNRNLTSRLLVNSTCADWNDTLHPLWETCVRYTEPSLMIGELGALVGTAVWLIVATMAKMPVSTTQSSVGAIVGMSLVLKGARGIHWDTVWLICASWVLSPLMTGALGTLFFLLIKGACLVRRDSFEASIKALPVIFFLTIAINGFTVFFHGSKYTHFNNLTWWESFLISGSIGALVALIIYFFASDRIRKRAIEMHETEVEFGFEEPKELVSPTTAIFRKLGCAKAEEEGHHHKEEEVKRGRSRTIYADIYWILKFKTATSDGGFTSLPNIAETKASEACKGAGTCVSNCEPCNMKGVSESGLMSESRPRGGTVLGGSPIRNWWRRVWQPRREEARTVKVFHFLQILSACFLSFSHGSNDTANSVSSLAALWVMWTYGTADFDVDDNWRLEMIIVFGAISMIIGLWFLGHKVIKTVGKDITELNAPVGFAIEMAAAFTILLGSLYKMPLSTTHCMVGGVMIVGWVRSRQKIEWRLLSGIAFAWLVTIPVAGGVSALVTFLLAHFYLGVV